MSSVECTTIKEGKRAAEKQKKRNNCNDIPIIPKKRCNDMPCIGAKGRKDKKKTKTTKETGRAERQKLRKVAEKEWTDAPEMKNAT